MLVGVWTTSSSRIDPPTSIARTPCSAAASTPSRNGKNASEASAAPAVASFASPALIAPIRAHHALG
jgi:hypothetical protein